MMAIAFDALSGVDGSARFSFGPGATAIASISGPIAPRLAAEHPVRATLDVHVRPLAAVPRTPEKHTALVLRGIFERACILAQHPRTAIQLVVQALSPPQHGEEGADLDADAQLAAQINAACLALLNAGSVPMRGVVCAVAVAGTAAADTSQGQFEARLVTDLGPRARTRPDHTGCFAFLFAVDPDVTPSPAIPQSKMIWTNYRARSGHAFSLVALADAERVALEGAAVVWATVKKSMRVSESIGDGQYRERLVRVLGE